MGRKKTYDEAEALNKAMLLIWRKGYQAVSTRELAAEMGINQFSLYASFESKEVLFERALEHYYQCIVEGWLAKPLHRPGAGKEALREFFEVFSGTPERDIPTGCMIFNTMAIDTAQHPEIGAIIEKYETLIVDGFAKILRHDFPQAGDVDIESKASLLLCFLAGILLKKRNGFEGHSVQLVVDQIISSIYLEKRADA